VFLHLPCGILHTFHQKKRKTDEHMEVDAEIDSRVCLLFLLFLPSFFIYTFVIEKGKKNIMRVFENIIIVGFSSVFFLEIYI